MQIYHFTCTGCRFELRLPLGSSDLDQVLTDVNADYAEYHLFRCNKESQFVHANIHGNDFDGKCAVDGSKLSEIKYGEAPVRCPRCSRDLVTAIRDPLAAEESSQ